jgi:hypothetical protein
LEKRRRQRGSSTLGNRRRWPRRVGAPVVHPRPHDLDLADAGGDGARRGVPVADQQPVAALIDQLGVGGEIGVDLGLQGGDQHPPGALAEQLVQIGGQLGPCLVVSHQSENSTVSGQAAAPGGAQRSRVQACRWVAVRRQAPG